MFFAKPQHESAIGMSPPPWTSLPSPSPFHPSRLIQSCLSSLRHTANSHWLSILHPLQQHKRRLYTWTSPDGQYRNQTDNILCSHRWRSSIWSAKPRPGAHCGSDHELLIAKFTLQLKKVGKTTRPFRYDENQIPYNYTEEMTNRFRGLCLIDIVPTELWKEVCDIVQEAVIKTIPKKK